MRRRLGLIARADSGGLGNLTWEFARHLKPDRVLVIDLARGGRGDLHLDRYAGLDYRVVSGPTVTDDAARAWLIDGCDVLYSAETWYDDRIAAEAIAAGVKTVLHAMPELHRPRLAEEVWVPTSYRRPLIRGARLVPVPVALDRFVYRPVTEAHHFVHLAAGAMLDRQGTAATTGAAVATTGLSWTFLGTSPPPEARPHMRYAGAGPENYWDLFPVDGDVLVMPRRYAGLSLPVQEAAARGMPAVMSAVEPQTRWPGVVGVPVHSPVPTRMAGGMVDVWSVASTDVTAAVLGLVGDPDRVALLSRAARQWAERLSWGVWADRYRSLLLD